MDKKKKQTVALVFVLLALGGYLAWKYLFTGENSKVEAAGTIEATTVDLKVKISGTVENFNIQAGDKVKAGDLLAVISRKDLEAQRERDLLNVAIARNRLNDLRSGARSQEIKEAQANVNIAQVKYEKAKKDLERMEALFQEGTIAQAELEVYQSNYTIALNQLEAAQARLNLLQSGNRADQIKAAENQVKLMEAVLKSTEAMLGDLKIYSPIDGTIQTKNFENGEYVQAGASLATVTNLDRVWINVYIPTDDLPYVKQGEKATFTISGVDKVFEGTIAEIATRGEFTPKTIQTKKERTNIVYKVKIEVDNPEKLLKPGMPADVVIPKYNSDSKKVENFPSADTKESAREDNKK